MALDSETSFLILGALHLQQQNVVGGLVVLVFMIIGEVVLNSQRPSAGAKTKRTIDLVGNIQKKSLAVPKHGQLPFLADFIGNWRVLKFLEQSRRSISRQEFDQGRTQVDTVV